VILRRGEDVNDVDLVGLALVALPNGIVVRMWAGVTFTTPVPNLDPRMSSAMMG